MEEQELIKLITELATKIYCDNQCHYRVTEHESVKTAMSIYRMTIGELGEKE